MARKAKTEQRIKAIRAMFKPIRDARIKREKRLQAAYDKLRGEILSAPIVIDKAS